MSLSTSTPEPRRRAAPKKPAAKKAPSRRAVKQTATQARPAAVRLPDAERLLRRFVQLLPDGEHAFSQLRQDFAEWCDAGDIAPPSHIKLAAWLTQSGLVSYRSGRAKVTYYAKRAARLAA
jgi:hypothetical protein